MNPSIPPEFFVSARAKHLTHEGESESGALSWPPRQPGTYGRAQVLPLQIFIIQRLLENPDLLNSPDLPEDIRIYFLNQFTDTGRLSIHNVGALSRNAVVLDWSYIPTFNADWLTCIASSKTLAVLHLAHVPSIDAEALLQLSDCVELGELSLGPALTGDFTQLGTVLGRVSCLHLFIGISAEDLLRDILSQLISENMVQIEIISASPVDWSVMEAHCKGVNILSISRIDSSITEEELAQIATHLPQFNDIVTLILDYNHDITEFMKPKLKTSWPMLREVWFGDLERNCLNDNEEWNASMNVIFDRLESLTEDIKSFRPLSRLMNTEMLAENMQEELLTGWLTELRYAIHLPEILQPALAKIASTDFPHHRLLVSHPLTMPILAQILRVYSKRNLTVFVATVSVLKALLEEDDENHSALLRLVFENNRQAIEDAIDACNIFNDDRSASDTHYSAQHVQLFNLIGLLAGLAPDDRYPVRLCLSNSPKIINFICQPWQRLSSITLKSYQILFSSLPEVHNNAAFCDKLHEAELALNVDEALDLFAPMSKPEVTLDSFAVDSAPNFGAIPQILTTMTPKRLRHLYFNHFSFLLKVMRMLPFSRGTDWLFPICTWVDFHANFGPPPNPQDTFCQHLENIMKSYRVNRGHLTGHVIVFMSTFCKECRRNFVEQTVTDPTERDPVPKNLISFMRMRQREDTLGYAKPISGWVLESKDNFEKWLDQLKMECEAPNIQAYNARRYFEYLNQQTWDSVSEAMNQCPEFNTEIPWILSLLLENFAIFSQLPLCTELLYEPIIEWIINMHLKYGHPAQTLSVLYHLGCLKEGFVSHLASMDRSVKRTVGGGRQYETGKSTPYRLIEPLTIHGDQEDMLSMVTESLLAGLTSFPEGTHVITLRTISNFSYHNEMLHRRLQESPAVAGVLEYTSAFRDNEGSILSRLTIALELYGDATREVLESLPVIVRKAISKSAIFHSIAAADKSCQPWWISLEAFILRTLFRRGLPIILSCYTDPKILESSDPVALGQQDTADLKFLVECTFRTALLEDVTTQEIAFQALEAALQIGEREEDAILTNAPTTERRQRLREIQLAVRLEILHLLRNYEAPLHQRAAFEHFGFTSKVREVYERVKQLWKHYNF